MAPWGFTECAFFFFFCFLVDCRQLADLLFLLLLRFPNSLKLEKLVRGIVVNIPFRQACLAKRLQNVCFFNLALRWDSRRISPFIRDIYIRMTQLCQLKSARPPLFQAQPVLGISRELGSSGFLSFCPSIRRSFIFNFLIQNQLVSLFFGSSNLPPFALFPLPPSACFFSFWRGLEGKKFMEEKLKSKEEIFWGLDSLKRIEVLRI